MKRINIKEAVNIAGNIASITGISLFWMQSLSGKVNVLFAAPILAIAALFTIGSSALAWFFWTLGYQRLAVPSSTRSGNAAVKIAYAALAGGGLLLLLAIVISFIYSFVLLALHDLAAT